jgi:hypothetical protein
MEELLASLSQDTVTRLRGLTAAAADVAWPERVAQARGWRAANELYHAQQRAQGQVEMDRLLGALGLRSPLAPQALRDVIETGIALYLQTEATTAVAQANGEGVRLTLRRCPLFERFSDPSWAGVTACGCFSRLDGWYEALGVPPEVELVANREWDHPVCEIILRLPLDRPAGDKRDPEPTVG